MATPNQIIIDSPNNNVDIQTNNNQLRIISEVYNTEVNVTQPVTTTIQVATPGPQGPKGDPGISLNNQIATGSITASVNIGADTFRVQSGSSTFLYISSSGNTTINNSLYIIQKASIGTTHQSASLTISASTAEDAILVKINDTNVTDKFKINNEGIMVLGKLDNPPFAVEGGIFFSSSNDYFFGFS